MYFGTARTWAGAEKMLDEARVGGLYAAKATPRLMAASHVEKGECPCDGTHYAIHRERKVERITPRSIAGEAPEVASRIPAPRQHPFRPAKGRKSPQSKHYAVEPMSTDKQRLADLHALATLRAAWDRNAPRVAYRQAE